MNYYNLNTDLSKASTSIQSQFCNAKPGMEVRFISYLYLIYFNWLNPYEIIIFLKISVLSYMPINLSAPGP